MAEKGLFGKVFLESEEGKRPILENKDEEDFAEMVYRFVNKGFEDEEDEDDGVLDVDIEEEAMTTRSIMRRTKDIYSKTNAAGNRFSKNFGEFETCRMKTIARLRDIANSIDKDRFNGNVSKIVSSCTGAIGTSVLVTAAVAHLAPPVAVPLTIAGGVAALVGSGALYGTKAVEVGLLKSKLGDAEGELDRDREAFKSMEDLFETTGELVKTINNVVGLSVIAKVAGDIKKFLGGIKAMKGGKEDCNKKFRALLQTSVKAMRANGAIKENFGVELAPIVITFWFVVCIVKERNRLVNERLEIMHRKGLSLLSKKNVSAELGWLVAGLVVHSGVFATKFIPQTASKPWAVGASAGVGLAVDVAYIAIASVDIHKGSMSKQAAGLRKAADELEREFQFLKELKKEFEAASVEKKKEEGRSGRQTTPILSNTQSSGSKKNK